jgi:hypothetical protein
VTGNFSGTLVVYLYGINIGAGANVLLGTLTTNVAGPAPLGYFDEASSPDPQKVRVRGWAFDPNSPKSSLRIHVYVGGPAGSGAPGYDAGSTTIARPDVVAVYPQAGAKTGFELSVSAPPGNRVIYVYAINLGPGDNVLLGSRSVVVAAPPPPPTLQSAPSIEGASRVGAVLTCRAAYSGATTVQYQWLRDGAYTGLRGQSYVVRGSDFGARLACQSWASNAGGTSTATVGQSTPPVALGPALKNLQAPTWRGNSNVGRVLRLSSAGRWAPAPESVRIQWLRNGRSIAGATHASYRLVRKDRGKFISVRVTALAHGWADGSRTSRRERV